VFRIDDLPLGAGQVGLCPLPGRDGDFAGDLATLLDWHPDMVLSLVGDFEREAGGAETLPRDLAAAGVAWRQMAVTDFRAPGAGAGAEWAEVSREARAILDRGGRVLAHCYGGCGRAGMALLRLMVDAGEAPESALARLRKARPCAVETQAQFAWAAGAMPVAAAAR
jgi:protein-tyrosine phosphatase